MPLLDSATERGFSIIYQIILKLGQLCGFLKVKTISF